MMQTILRLICLIPAALRLRSELALENLALRQQLAILNRQHRRPKLRRLDRFFWLFLSRFWPDWKETLIIVKPETVLRWHRKRFASYWSRFPGTIVVDLEQARRSGSWYGGWRNLIRCGALRGCMGNF